MVGVKPWGSLTRGIGTGAILPPDQAVPELFVCAALGYYKPTPPWA